MRPAKTARRVPWSMGGVIGAVVGALFVAGSAFADDAVVLRESPGTGARQITVRFSGSGTRRGGDDAAPAPSDGGQTSSGVAAPAAASTFGVEARLQWTERELPPGNARGARVTVRRIRDARAKIVAFRGENQTLTLALRPELALMIAERRDDGVAIVSAGGPLTRDELDLVSSPGDPMFLASLLPDQAVAKGSEWDVSPALCKLLSEYSTLHSSTVKATLTGLDDRAATIHFAGEIKGSVLGAEGTTALSGEAHFDRVAGLITKLKVERTEARGAGPIEPALNAQSSFTLERVATAIPDELSDGALSELPLEITPQRELLLLQAPGREYTLTHDRQWHLCGDDARHVILKRLDAAGRVVAQCNLIIGPNAGRGRHQDVEQFRSDVSRAIGERLARILGTGVVSDDARLGFRYKMAVEGVETAQGVVPLWYYFLIASPAGDQVVAIFTLSRAYETAFADHDLRLVGTLEFTQPGPRTSNGGNGPAR